jgi:hypothetical protein
MKRVAKRLPPCSPVPVFTRPPGVGDPECMGSAIRFTVERMVEWQRAGLPLKDLLPTLSVYLGHVPACIRIGT